MRRALLIAWVALVCAGTAWAERRPMTPEDLYRFQWVADPRISPDASSVCFVRVVCDSADGRDGYASTLWLVSTEGDRPKPRRLTSGPGDTSPRWSPNGKTVAFLRPDPETKTPQIWLLSLEGGEAIQLTDLPHSAGTPHWSPDGSLIAFEGSVPNPDAGHSIRVITEPEFRRNGSGYRDSRRHLFTVDIRNGNVTQLTDGPFEEQFASWSPENSTLFFTSDRRPEPWRHTNDSDLYAVSYLGGDPVKLIDLRGEISKAAVNARGEWALVSDLNEGIAQSYNQLDLVSTPPANPRSLLQGKHVFNHTENFDGDLGNYVATDMAAPRGGGSWSPIWSNNLKSVYVIVSEKGTSNLARIDLKKNEISLITPGENAVLSMSATPDTDHFALVLASDRNPGDVWFTDHKGNHLKRLTSFNDDLLSETMAVGYEKLTITSEDSLSIDGWLLKPVDYEPWDKHPLIVQIHGGPHIAYGENFFHEFQVMAGRGYLVLFTNPRGSATYGEEFAQKIQYAYPGGDVYDILSAVDHVVDRSIVDTERMGITGGSGGGYLTNWIVIKDHRFKAAATQRCVSEWLSFYSTADFSMYTPFWFQKQPWENPTEYIQRSPAFFANRVRTPLLILHAEDDLRTPINQAEAMFRAMLGAGREAVMVRIPGENHNLSRSGSPSNRVARLNYLLDWFDSHLLQKQVEWLATGD